MDASSHPAPAQDVRLRLQLLGGFSLQAQGQALRIPARKERWLLALLALAEGAPRTRQALQDALWPWGEAGDPAYNLRRSLSRLRKALGNHAHRLQAPTRQTLRFDLDGAFVDALAFDALPDAETALALYAGPLLPDCGEPWAVAERQRLHLRYQQRVAGWARERLERGELDSLPARLLAALALDPLWEEGRRLLMRAQAAQGQPHQALQSYQDLVRHLRQTDPRLSPDPETTALWRQIRDQARHSPESPAAPPAASSLPTARTRFIGREREVADLAQRLADARLVTLTGSGGCGKTRLALEVAHRLAASFPEGVFWVELASLSNPDLVPQTLAQALRVKARADEPVAAALADALGDRRLLLALDNCEHLLSSVAALTDALLRACPHLAVLATSRERLNLSGEATYRVPSLSVPPSGCSAGALARYESSLLFVERAQAARSDFAVTERDAPALSSLCRRLDGIPLAIELAAARAVSLSLEELNRRLTDRFALLMGGSRDAPSRHQTLRALTGWSFDLLNEAERRLFARLSVFAGGWTLEAAERVCGGAPLEADAVLDLLLSLVSKSLVERVGAEEETRYRFLETVHQFAIEHLSSSGEEETLRDRHLDYFLKRAEETVGQFHIGYRRWMDALERDHDNLRAAMRHASKQPRMHLRMARALHVFWSDRGHLAEGREYMRAALAASDPKERDALRAEALYAATWLGAGPAPALLEEALSLYRELGDRYGEADCLNTMGLFCGEDYAAKRAYSEQAWALYNALGDPITGHGCLHLLCGNALNYCDFEMAWKYLKEAQSLIDEFPGREEYASSGDTYSRRVVRELGDSFPGIESVLNWLPWRETMLLVEAGEMESARGVCESWLVRMQAAGVQVYVRAAEASLAEIYRELGDYERARSVIRGYLRWSWDRREFAEVSEWLRVLAPLVWVEEGSLWGPRLWGAAEAFCRTDPARWLPLQQRRYARHTAAARLALGEAAFAAAWEEGRSMPVEEAIAYALQFEG